MIRPVYNVLDVVYNLRYPLSNQRTQTQWKLGWSRLEHKISAVHRAHQPPDSIYTIDRRFQPRIAFHSKVVHLRRRSFSVVVGLFNTILST
jgi:hypothetical protein